MADVITPDRNRRELDHRAADGIEVRLLWSPADDTVVVEVFECEAGNVFEFAVERDQALNAFHHPYAYAGLQELRSTLSIDRAA